MRPSVVRPDSWTCRGIAGRLSRQLLRTLYAVRWRALSPLKRTFSEFDLRHAPEPASGRDLTVAYARTAPTTLANGRASRDQLVLCSDVDLTGSDAEQRLAVDDEASCGMRSTLAYDDIAHVVAAEPEGCSNNPTMFPEGSLKVAQEPISPLIGVRSCTFLPPAASTASKDDSRESVSR